MPAQYATTAQFRALGLAGGLLARVPSNDLEVVLQAASSEANGILGQRYPVPFEKWGLDLTAIVCDIAAYRIPPSYKASPADAAVLMDRYTMALERLKAIASGEDDLDIVIDAAGGAGEPARASAVVVTSDVRGWTDRGKTADLDGFWNRYGS